VPHPDGWALLVDDLDVAAWVVRTKARAVAAARDAATHHRARLDVLTRTGRLQHSWAFQGV
jgi:hypothetical protein